MIKTAILLLILTSYVRCSVKRHVIYWNSIISAELLGVKSDQILEVKIGQFMDIICPQTSLMESTYGPEGTETFDLYNVTKPYFDQCRHGGRKNFIFACDRPERENKLTIKFQTISPSPLGFRFQYCQDYYFVALPRNSESVGCQNKTSTRLHIHVACKNPTTRKPPTTTTIQTTTTSPKPPIEPDMDESIVNPKIVTPSSTVKATNEIDIDHDDDEDVKSQPQTSDKNASPRHIHKTSLLIVSIFLSLVSSHALTTSDHVR